jgi:anthranilate phosphoribosyltransferase
MQELLKKVIAGEHLTTAEAARAMDLIMDGTATQSQIAGLLVSLKLKGERAHEVVGFVESMRRHAIRVAVNDVHAVDGCGTGGDGAHTFNVSTAACLVAAAAGVSVAKHGNRAVSSKCGSADLLEACGGQIDPGPAKVEESIASIGFGFLFAPRFHPAMKHAAAPRKELGVRTVFNILGPMSNPAGVKRQVVGVFDKKLLWLVAEVLAMTGSEHVIVAHSQDGLDEFSVSAPTDFVEWKDGEYREDRVLPVDLIGTEYPRDILSGGEASENLDILRKVLAGEASPYSDAALVNAGALIYVAGRAKGIPDGVKVARAAIQSGAAEQKLHDWIRISQS